MNGISRISVESLLSHSTEKTLLGNTSVFHKVSGIDKLMDKSGGGGERGYHDFRSQLFSLTKTKFFVREPFSVSLISGMGNFYAYEGILTIFYRKSVVSQYRKSS